MTPARIAWAVERLDLTPGDRVLEIGCGRGAATRLICEAGAVVTGLDRSATAIEAAVTRNADLFAAGRASFHTTALETTDPGSARFDRILAVNVNLFWLDASRGLATVRRLLAPAGRLHLVYDPPSPDRVEAIAAKLARNLAAAGFEIETLTAPSPGLLGLRAWVAA